jgi:hypothetical protein
MKEAWGQTVTGTNVTEMQKVAGADGAATLNMGLVRKKRKAGAEERKEPPSSATNDEIPQVNVISTVMIRKKAKV